MKSRIKFESNASLFILDTESVFFDECRQELYVYNTPATFVWCCLEEGMQQAEIGPVYAGTFGVTQSEADRHVASLLARWQGMGYITGADLSRSGPIDWVTAVSRLLINQPLREEFRKSPRKAIRKLRVRAPDRSAILMLDAEKLDAQADHLAARRSALRGSVAVAARQIGAVAPLHEMAACQAGLCRRRYYRVRGRSIMVEFASPALEARVHSAIAHMKVRRPAAIDVRLDVLSTRSGHAVLDGLAPLAFCERLDQLTPLVKAAFWQAVHAKPDYFLEIHAGVVSNGERCLLLPAAPGCGKTTLTAALIASGFQYFSDEVALLEEPSLEVRPVPLGLTIKPGSIAALDRWYPHLRKLRMHVRQDDETVCYLPPPSRSLPADPEKRQPVAWVVFPRYRPGAETLLRPLSRPAALQRLMEECLTIPEPLTHCGVVNFVEWMRGLACFEMDVSSLDCAVEQIRRVCR